MQGRQGGAACDPRDSGLSASLPSGKLWRAARRSPAWWCTSLRTAQVRLGQTCTRTQGCPRPSFLGLTRVLGGGTRTEIPHLWRCSQGSLSCRTQKVRMEEPRQELLFTLLHAWLTLNNLQLLVCVFGNLLHGVRDIPGGGYILLRVPEIRLGSSSSWQQDHPVSPAHS